MIESRRMKEGSSRSGGVFSTPETEKPEPRSLIQPTCLLGATFGAAVGGIDVDNIVGRVPLGRVARAPTELPEGATGYNLILIMLDTTRVDCLGCYGPTECRTPNIDRLAAQQGLGDVPWPADDIQAMHGEGFRMPPEFLRMMWLRYMGEIEYVDENVGDFLKAIDEMGLADGTVVILVCDHGESFEHDFYFGHGSRLYDHLVHVGLMCRLPANSRYSPPRECLRRCD